VARSTEHSAKEDHLTKTELTQHSTMTARPKLTTIAE
jgi:hypothetical protein